MSKLFVSYKFIFHLFLEMSTSRVKLSTFGLIRWATILYQKWFIKIVLNIRIFIVSRNFNCFHIYFGILSKLWLFEETFLHILSNLYKLIKDEKLIMW